MEIKKKYIIGIDIGTSTTKAVLISSNGEIKAKSMAKHALLVPKLNWAEQDSLDWWKGVIETIRGVVGEAKINRREVVAISISSQSSVILPIDNKGDTLDNAIIWMDNRAENIRKSFNKRFWDKIKIVNPNSIRSYSFILKIYWFLKNKPDIFEKAYKFLQCNGYIIYKLTGCFSIDKSSAGLIHLYNFNTQNWDGDLCKEIGIPIDKLPKIYECDEIVGKLTEQASEKLGLDRETRVIAGGVDTSLATLGSGVITEGSILYSMGTGSNLVVPTKKNVFDNGMSYELTKFPHVIEGINLIVAITTSTGGSLEWFRKEIAQLESIYSQQLKINPYEIIDLKINNTSTGSGGLIFLPYLSGELSPIWDLKAKGVFFGLTNNSSKSQMARSVLEGVGYTLKHNIDFLTKVTKLDINQIIVTGGPTRSHIWMQILSDIIQKQIKITNNPEGAAFGNAILAGKALGIYSNLNSTTKEIIKNSKTFYPNVSNKGIYENFYIIYCNIYKSLKKIFNNHEEIIENFDIHSST